MFDKNELNQLYRYCYALVDNEADAYDLLQSSLEKYIRATPENVSNRNSYMRKIIRNQFIDQYHANKKMESEEFNENNITNINDELSSLEKIVINKEEAEIIWNLLDFSEREIMYLWAIQGFTTSEVAGFLGIPKGTIVSKVSRLRKRVISQTLTNKTSSVA